MLFLLGAPLFTLAGEPLPFCESFGSSDNDSQTYSWILFGHRDDKIAFVIFQNTHGTNVDYSKHIHLTLLSTNTPAGFANVGKGWIDMPDGTKRDLPSSHMIFEYTDGVFQSVPIKMPYSDFSRYLNSVNTNAWGPIPGLTIADLERFEKTTKAKSSTIRWSP